VRLAPSLAFHALVHYRIRRTGRIAAGGGLTDEAWATESLAVLRACERVGIRVEVAGGGNLGSAQGPCVIVGNHMSSLETLALPCLVLPYTPMTFVIKESLLRYPYLGDILRATHAIAVTRTNPREDLRTVMEQGMRRLAAGTSVAVFPQTTRSPSFDRGEFNSIGVKLALRAGVPVVPLALRTDAWGTGRMLKDYGRIDPAKDVRFSFGPPLAAEGRGVEAHDRTIAFIEGELARWGVGVARSHKGAA
jgi:1-acyl-sn-glycerol-3-phosphate acyltransferase